MGLRLLEASQIEVEVPRSWHMSLGLISLNGLMVLSKGDLLWMNRTLMERTRNLLSQALLKEFWEGED